MNDVNKLKRITRIISCVIFLFSITQKCYCTVTQCADSALVFLLGWFAIFSGGAGISWLANPLLIIAWILVKKNVKATVILSALATLLALSFLLFDNIIANEGGNYQQIIAYKTGYWLWISSCIIMLAGSFIVLLKQKNVNPANRNFKSDTFSH